MQLPCVASTTIFFVTNSQKKKDGPSTIASAALSFVVLMLNEKEISRVRYLMSAITNVSASFFPLFHSRKGAEEETFLSWSLNILTMMLHNELCENFFLVFLSLRCLLISLVGSHDASGEDKCSLSEMLSCPLGVTAAIANNEDSIAKMKHCWCGEGEQTSKDWLIYESSWVMK